MSKNKSLTWLAVLVLLCGLFSTLFLDEVWGSRVSEIVTISTAIIGAVALFFSLREIKKLIKQISYWNFGNLFQKMKSCKK